MSGPAVNHSGTAGRVVTHDPRSLPSELSPLERRDLRFSSLAGLLVRLNRRRPFPPLLRYAQDLEGGPFHSGSVRRWLLERHGVYVGAYSYGPCLTPGAFPPDVTIGRYVSIAAGAKVFRRNHPMGRLSLHPFFYNAGSGVVAADTIESTPLWIGHDSWLGAHSIVTPGCQHIGVGAVVAAGAIVTKDVPPFAIVGGNPARLIRMRFPTRLAEHILDSRWWERPVHDLSRALPILTRDLSIGDLTHPLLRAGGA